MQEGKAKKWDPELEKALDSLSNKMNIISFKAGEFIVLDNEKVFDSIEPNDLKKQLEKAVNSFKTIESANQEAGKIIRETIVKYLRKNNQ